MADVIAEVTPEDLTPDEQPKPRRKRKTDNRPTTRAGRAAASRARRERESLAAPFQAFLEMGASIWMIRDPECGGVLQEQAGAIADGMNVWAQSDPKVYRVMSRWLEGGGAGALIIAVWPVAAQLADHHVAPAIERIRERRAERELETWEEPTAEAPAPAPTMAREVIEEPRSPEVLLPEASRPA